MIDVFATASDSVRRLWWVGEIADGTRIDETWIRRSTGIEISNVKKIELRRFHDGVAWLIYLHHK